MVLHCPQSQPPSKYTLALIIGFLTPAIYKPRHTTQNTLPLSSRLCLLLTLVEIPLCRTPGLQTQPCLLLHQESEKCGGLAVLASICPTKLPPRPCPQRYPVSALQSTQAQYVGRGGLGCHQVALEGGQNNKRRGCVLLPHKPKILSKLLYPKCCNSASGQSLGRSGPCVIRNILRRWKRQQLCHAVPPHGRETKTQKRGNQGHQQKPVFVNKSIFFCLRFQSCSPPLFRFSPLL